MQPFFQAIASLFRSLNNRDRSSSFLYLNNKSVIKNFEQVYLLVRSQGIDRRSKVLQTDPLYFHVILLYKNDC